MFLFNLDDDELHSLPFVLFDYLISFFDIYIYIYILINVTGMMILLLQLPYKYTLSIHGFRRFISHLIVTVVNRELITAQSIVHGRL